MDELVVVRHSFVKELSNLLVVVLGMGGIRKNGGRCQKKDIQLMAFGE